MTQQTYTAVILGGGPAGCQCALWLKMLGLDPVILEASDHLGGLQAQSPYQNHWIAGLIDTSGRELAQRIQRHIELNGIQVHLHASVTSFQKTADGFILDVKGQSIHAKTLVIATGSIHHEQSEAARRPTDQSAHDETYAQLSMTSSAGWQANLPSAFASIKSNLLNNDGFIITNADCETPVAGIYAIGEAANRMHPCVITSMADGVVAAKAIQMLDLGCSI